MRCTVGLVRRLSSPRTPASTALRNQTDSLPFIPMESETNPTELDTKLGTADTAAVRPRPRQLTMCPSSATSLSNYARQCPSIHGVCMRWDTQTVESSLTNSHANSPTSSLPSGCRLGATSSLVAIRQTPCRSSICTELPTQTCRLTVARVLESRPQRSRLRAVPLMQWRASMAAMSHLPSPSSQAIQM